ncbi:MAG: hypothetical protein IJV64_01875 [Oscillospiraceae bacterium]|nr:hypothetical protein [Oscillospiraceae bacterium]
MARRPVFLPSDQPPYYRAVPVDFTFYSGFADSQKRKSVHSLQHAFLAQYPDERVLEISSASEETLGTSLSAFLLSIELTDGRTCSVESIFQSSKVFERGGPYHDLLNKSSREAKKDPRLKNSGRLIAFNALGQSFPLTPTNYFYNWLYINVVHCHSELADALMAYSAFTDIAFNPLRSVNCQACAAATYVALRRGGLLKKALTGSKEFLRIVYGEQPVEGKPQAQLDMWGE